MEEIFNNLTQIRDGKKRRAFLKRKGLSKTEIDKILEEVHILVKGRKKFPRAKCFWKKTYLTTKTSHNTLFITLVGTDPKTARRNNLCFPLLPSTTRLNSSFSTISFMKSSG